MESEKVSGLEKFFMVWNENSKMVTQRHYSYNKACTEAERLAAKHPQVKFYVLMVTSWRRQEKVLTLDTPITIREWMDLPDEVIAQLSKKLQAEIRNYRNVFSKTET